MKILAIDASETSTGLCLGRPGETPTFSNVDFLPPLKEGQKKAAGNEDYRGAARRAYDWLDGLLERDPEIALVVLEAPAKPQGFQGHTSAQTIITTMYIAVALMLAAHKHGVKIWEPSVRNTRSVFLGVATLGRAEAKREAKRVCQAIGWKPKNIDQADAGALWWCSANHKQPGSVPDVRPHHFEFVDAEGKTSHRPPPKPKRERAPEDVLFKKAA